MTMKPKARKFRIRRSAPQKGAAFEGGDGRAPRDEARERAHEDQQPAQTRAPDQEREQERFQGRERPAATGTEIARASAGERPRTHEGQVSTSREMAASQDISQIRREGLTGRQLRMARRIAQKHGLAPTSDFDAVRLLRARGIDPFQRSSMLELVSSDDGGSEQTENHDRVQLPQTVQPATTQLPSTEVSPAERRSEEIMRIQRDIGRRRRRKLALLFARLAAFVFLPTLVAGYYYYVAATPMYSTKSEFLILVADGGGGAGGGKLGGLLPSQFATGQDAIATQSYLTSKDAMLRLNRDEGFRAHFSQPWIDPIQRLDPDASTEDVYSLYKKYVKLGYDPTEGVLRMEVSTADPEVSQRFSEKLIEYAEERVDQLSQRKREDAVKTAVASLEEAKEARREAQRRMVELQEQSVLDPEGEIANIRQLIGNVELQLQEKQLALQTQLNNSRPNQAKVEALRSEVEVLQRELDKQNDRLTQATEGKDSLASQSAAIQMAQADLATADLILQSALENKRASEVEANKQVRYLTVSVKPVASEDPSYPRSFENTMLAFLIFAGIYLMVSLTASILREQVSS